MFRAESISKPGGKGKIARITKLITIPVKNIHTKRHFDCNIVTNLAFIP
jgi:hypothetical protein